MSNPLALSGRAAWVGCLVFASTWLSLAWFALPAATIATVWPTSGLMLAALLLAPLDEWPLLLSSAGLAMSLAQLWAGTPLLVSMALTLVHLTATLLAATLVRRWFPAPLVMNHLRDLVGLIVLAAVASNVLTASLGALVVWASSGASFWLTWSIWFVADGSSILLFTPLVLSWFGPARLTFPIPRRRLAEAGGLLLGLLLVGGGIFVANTRTGAIAPYPLIPFLIWAVRRFQMRGTTVVVLCFTSLVMPQVAQGYGPFVTIFDAQQYLVVMAASAYVIAALVAEQKTGYAAQQVSAATLHSFFDSTTVLMGIVELLDDDILHFADNATTLRFFGLPLDNQTYPYRASVIGVPPTHIRLWREQYATCLRRGAPVTFEYPHTTANEVRWLVVTVSQIPGLAQAPPRFAYVAEDVTERKAAEAALRASEQRWQYALNAVNDGLWDWDVQTGAVFFSDRWQIMLGYTPGEIEGRVRAWERLAHPDDLPQVLATLQNHLDGHTAWYECEYRCRTKTGTWLWILDRGQVIVRDEAGQPLRVVGTYIDVSERHALEAELRVAHDNYAYQATHDALTSLLNRRAITDHVSAELARANRDSLPLSLLLLDLDHFKAVNDQHGHLVGDQALSHSAQILLQTVRPYDWVGRWGGEEFLVVLSNTALEGAMSIAERLRTQFSAHALHLAEGKALPLTVSIGVACTDLHPAGDVDPAWLFQRADEALYAAKHAGRNQVRCAELVAATPACPLQQ